MEQHKMSNTDEALSFLTEGLEKNDTNLIGKSLSLGGVSPKIIKQIIKTVDEDSMIFKHLIALTLIQMANTFDDDTMKICKKTIGFCGKYYLGIYFDESDIPTENIENANLEIASIDNTDLESESFVKYCDKIMKTFWPKDLPKTLQYVTLILCENYIYGSKLLELQPFLKKEDTSPFQVVCAIFEMLDMYFLLLKEVLNSLGLDSKEIVFPNELEWCFDNADNPIEKTMEAHLKENTDIKCKQGETCRELVLTIDEYHQFVKKTYDIEKMAEKIKTHYFIDEIESRVSEICQKSEIYHATDKKFLIELIVCHFFLNLNICDYLK